jgi:signal recognition particle subunit SRP68
MSNGIKRGDFERYRNYCTGKVKKIRKAMGFKYSTPKIKFTPKKIELDRAKDPRVLQLLLFNAEKNWAHAN